MTDNGREQIEKATVKEGMDLEAKLADVTKKLNEKKQEIRAIEQQMVQNQRQLQASKDAAMSVGLELQGQQKLLLSLLGKTEKDLQAQVSQIKQESKKEEKSEQK